MRPTDHQTRPAPRRLARPYGQGVSVVADGRQARDSLSALRDFVSDLVGIRSMDAALARLLRHLVIQTGAQGACVTDEDGQIRADWWRGARTGVAARPAAVPTCPWPDRDAELPAWGCLEVTGQPMHVWVLFEHAVPTDEVQRLADLSVQLLALAPAVGGHALPPEAVTATKAVLEGLEPDEVLNRTADLLVPRLGDACIVYERRDDALDAVAVRVRGDEPVSLEDLGEPSTHLWPALDDREAILVAGNDEDGQNDFDPALGEMQSAMFVPLVSGGETIGGVAVFSARVDGFNLRDMELAEMVAGSSAAALMASTARVDVKRMADVLVKASLPPRIPTISGFELAALYVPVSDAAEVGGDWYDALELRGGRVAFVVGDVAGHGLGAATTMSQLRNGLRAFLSEGHGPARSLALLNHLAQLSGAGEVATVLVGILDPADGTVRTASAGALPPLLVRAQGSPDEDPAPTGPLVGAFADADYQEHLWMLGEGDLFLAFTDGVVERRDRDIDEGRAWLADHGRTRPTGPPDSFCQLLIEDLRSDGAGEDDICMLALERTPRDRTALRRRIAADTALLGPLRAEVRAQLEGRDDEISDRALDDVELVLAELLANAVEASPDDEEIEVYVGYGTGRVTVEVTDLGQGFTLPTEISVEPLAERGRGLLLVHAIADRVDVRSADDGTHVRAVVRTHRS